MPSRSSDRLRATRLKSAAKLLRSGRFKTPSFWNLRLSCPKKWVSQIGLIVRAAEFWAIMGQPGILISSPDALDAGAILAGRAGFVAQPGDTVTIATTNVTHLNRFPVVDAETR